MLLVIIPLSPLNYLLVYCLLVLLIVDHMDATHFFGFTYFLFLFSLHI